MPASTNPIFSKLPKAQWAQAVVSAANTTKDGTGTVQDVFTAGADGSYLQKMIIRPRGTNVATVLRVFLNNGSTNATAANNALISEVTMGATTVSETSANPGVELPLNFAIPTGYKLFVTLGTVVAAGFTVAVVGGDY